MINRKFSGPLGRATKFSHPRATMSVIVVMFIAANKFTAFCAIRLLDFRPTDHRRQQNIGGVRVLVASTTKGVDVTLGGDSVLADPARRPFAPVVRLLREIYGIHPVGEREILAYSRIGARRDDPGMARSLQRRRRR